MKSEFGISENKISQEKNELTALYTIGGSENFFSKKLLSAKNISSKPSNLGCQRASADFSGCAGLLVELVGRRRRRVTGGWLRSSQPPVARRLRPREGIFPAFAKCRVTSGFEGEGSKFCPVRRYKSASVDAPWYFANSTLEL